MLFKSMIAVLSCLFVSSIAMADLDPWTDYEVSDAVWSVTTVKVDSNMGDAYLEGLRETWVPGNKISKELGQIEDWWIYRSDLQSSGDFNLLLVVKFADTAALAPNKEELRKVHGQVHQGAVGQDLGICTKELPGDA